jgi:hypothetical protein
MVMNDDKYLNQEFPTKLENFKKFSFSTIISKKLPPKIFKAQKYNKDSQQSTIAIIVTEIYI